MTKFFARAILTLLCVLYAGQFSACAPASPAPALRALRVETATVSESADVTEVTARIEPADAETNIAWSLDWSETRPETVTDFVRMETTAADPARVRLLPLRAFSGAMTLRAEAVGYPGIFGETAVTFGERFPAISLPLSQAGTPTPAAPVPVQSPSRIELHYAGLNLFDATKVSGDYAGLKVTHNPDGTFNLRGEPTKKSAYPTDGGSLVTLSGLEAGDAPYIRIDYDGNQRGETFVGLAFYDAQGGLIGNYTAIRNGVWYRPRRALASPAATAGVIVLNLTPGVFPLGNYTEINNIRIDVRRDAPSGDCLPYESETVEIAPRDREGNAVELYGGVAGAENTIEYRDGLPYYVRRTGKLVFDGSADEGWYAPGVSGDPSRSRMATTKYGGLLKKGTYVKPKALWTIGTAAQWGDPLMGKVSNSFSTNTEGSLTILTFYADEYSADNALTRWKAYLSEHPSEFYFELETPVLTALDPASLPALEYRSSGYTVTTDVEGLIPAFTWHKAAQAPQANNR